MHQLVGLALSSPPSAGPTCCLEAPCLVASCPSTFEQHHPIAGSRYLHVSSQAARGNAAAAGIKPGDTIIYASSFFGDELWPTDSKGLTQSALAACPSPVALVYVRPLLTCAGACCCCGVPSTQLP